MKLKKIPVKISNLTKAEDIIKDLSKTARVKRASINLDDVIFCQSESEAAEKPLFFPFNLIFKERIRRGIPALCIALQEAGYDIWVYTAGYASTNYISQMFRHYRIKVDGIINGLNHANNKGVSIYDQAKPLMEKKYNTTIHIDTEHVVWVRLGTKEFEDIPVNSQDEKWANNVISIVRGLKDI